jgi:hypothetical protein
MATGTWSGDASVITMELSTKNEPGQGGAASGATAALGHRCAPGTAVHHLYRRKTHVADDVLANHSRTILVSKRHPPVICAAMPSKRDVLAQLSREELIYVVERFELEVEIID